MKIAVILGTTRIGRQSEKAADALVKQLAAQPDTEVTLLDIAKYPFPVFEERLSMKTDLPVELTHFSEQLASADAMVWLTPEYNGGYPGAFKNAFDHFRTEYTKKPVGICCVSDGKFAGIQASLQLQTLAVHVGAYVCPTKWLVGNVTKVFDAQNKITDELTAKGLDRFVQEYLWLARAIVEHKKKH